MPNKEKKAFVLPHPCEEGKAIKHFEAKSTQEGKTVYKAPTEKEAAEGAIKLGFEAHILKDPKHKGTPKPEHFKKFVPEEHAKEIKNNKRPHKVGDICGGHT
ncbi:hypothetical protein FAI41_02400 [Acetobacteraceae bacterium]|nr:hypothetical protein FAI41_02400 [Acetobacteraceae bacterium]